MFRNESNLEIWGGIQKKKKSKAAFIELSTVLPARMSVFTIRFSRKKLLSLAAAAAKYFAHSSPRLTRGDFITLNRICVYKKPRSRKRKRNETDSEGKLLSPAFVRSCSWRQRSVLSPVNTLITDDTTSRACFAAAALSSFSRLSFAAYHSHTNSRSSSDFSSRFIFFPISFYFSQKTCSRLRNVRFFFYTDSHGGDETGGPKFIR